MNLKLMLSYCLLLIAATAFSQPAVTICGEAYVPGRPVNVTIMSPLKNPVGNEFVYLAKIPVNLNNTFQYKLQINKPQFIEVKFAGEANIIYVVPGDSVHIKFEELGKPVKKQSLWVIIGVKEKVYVSGNDPTRLGFFYSLEDQTG